MSESSSPANGNYDFEFALFSDLSAGSQLGSTITLNEVAVIDGSFTVKLDFGSVFPGAGRWLEIRVRQSALSEDAVVGAFTTLIPRQAVTSAPYSVRSLSSTSSTNAAQLGGVDANQYVLTTDPRMTNARTPTPGSGSYIQNTTTLQSASDFNISGTGKANVFDVGLQFNLGGNRILSAGLLNLFVGTGAGENNTSGNANSILGTNAGVSNTTGSSNSFFGTFSGNQNTTSSFNSFFGYAAGSSNTLGDFNAFFGNSSGFNNTTASGNSFFGSSSGPKNTTGANNSFFGRSAGFNNTTGADNSFFGRSSGRDSTTANNNSFFGKDSGLVNTTGANNAFFGMDAGSSNSIGWYNSFFGRSAGNSNTTGENNSFFGRNAGDTNTTGSNNTIIGRAGDVGSVDLTYATAIGSGAVVTASNTVQIGRDGSDTVRIGKLGTAGTTALCLNPIKEVSSCSSSIRYKSNIEEFRPGLDLIMKLRPVSFNWNEGGMLDLGLVAEEVEKIEPVLTTTNSEGEIEGVKYDRIGMVLVNAVKEQQAQIEKQKEIIKRQQESIDALKALVCENNKTADICKQ
ncbi:MAG: tail fiber domain-containing protein [Pyrinomonadaceae bacterium]|nr:tail fiber domain-containing protein [Pyrinomonadaceae bacterium]